MQMARLVVLCLLVAESSSFAVPIIGSLRRGECQRQPRLRHVQGIRASAKDDKEIDEWARNEAAKSIVDAMYLKAANMIKTKRPLSVKAAAAAYTAYGLFFGILLLKTLSSFPLVPPAVNSLAWCRSWLWTTVFDYCACTTLAPPPRCSAQLIGLHSRIASAQMARP